MTTVHHIFEDDCHNMQDLYWVYYKPLAEDKGVLFWWFSTSGVAIDFMIFQNDKELLMKFQIPCDLPLVI